MIDTLTNLGLDDVLSNKQFEEVFETLDKDKNGTVEKEEMVIFIK